jgi:hypothetical protein
MLRATERTFAGSSYGTISESNNRVAVVSHRAPRQLIGGPPRRARVCYVDLTAAARSANQPIAPVEYGHLGAVPAGLLDWMGRA